jgi:hypothetical protein
MLSVSSLNFGRQVLLAMKMEGMLDNERLSAAKPKTEQRRSGIA